MNLVRRVRWINMKWLSKILFFMNANTSITQRVKCKKIYVYVSIHTFFAFLRSWNLDLAKSTLHFEHAVQLSERVCDAITIKTMQRRLTTQDFVSMKKRVVLGKYNLQLWSCVIAATSNFFFPLFIGNSIRS